MFRYGARIILILCPCRAKLTSAHSALQRRWIGRCVRARLSVVAPALIGLKQGLRLAQVAVAVCGDIGRGQMETPWERVVVLGGAFRETCLDAELLAEAKRMGLEIGPITGEEQLVILARIYASSDDVKRETREAIRVKQ